MNSKSRQNYLQMLLRLVNLVSLSMEKQEDNQIPRVRSLTTLAMIFLSIADLLIVASVLPSTLTITSIASMVAFAQQQSAHEENQPDGKQVEVSGYY